MFHPATLLLAWAAFAFVLSALSLGVLAMLLVPALILAAWIARRRTLFLMKRARWLLASIGALFAFATPGVFVPGPLGSLGVTQDGLLLAGEHLSRLLLLLSTLALLHESLGTKGFIGGLYWLLAPLSHWRGLRERIAVRLMLVLEFVEARQPGGWRHWLDESNDDGPDKIALEVRPARWQDRATMLAVACAVVALAW